MAKPSITQKETWKDIPGYEGLYQASDMGNIRSLKYGGVDGKVRLLKPGYITKGYHTVCLYKNGERNRQKVHRLVMLTFVGPSKLFVNHKNWCVTDNRLSNLEYVTHAQNNAYKNPNLPYKKRTNHVRNGKKVSSAKLNETKVRKIKSLLERGEPRQDVADQFGVSYGCIQNIARGSNWAWVK